MSVCKVFVLTIVVEKKKRITLGMERESHEIVINFNMKHENSESQLVLPALRVS